MMMNLLVTIWPQKKKERRRRRRWNRNCFERHFLDVPIHKTFSFSLRNQSLRVNILFPQTEQALDTNIHLSTNFANETLPYLPIWCFSWKCFSSNKLHFVLFAFSFIAMLMSIGVSNSFCSSGNILSLDLKPPKRLARDRVRVLLNGRANFHAIFVPLACGKELLTTWQGERERCDWKCIINHSRDCTATTNVRGNVRRSPCRCLQAQTSYKSTLMNRSMELCQIIVIFALLAKQIAS